MRGNSIVRHLGESYDEIVLVGGFSKAYSSLLAFVACPTAIKNLLKVAAAPYLYSGPSPIASLASALAGFEVNEREGRRAARRPSPDDRARPRLRSPGSARRRRTAPGSRSSRCRSRTTTQIDAVGRFLFERGIYVTLAAYPLVPKDEVGFRIQVTAANTDEQITRLIGVLGELADRFALQPAR